MSISKRMRSMQGAIVLTILSVSPSIVNGYQQFITDTSGYVVQSVKDAAGESSPINGTHFPGGAPVEGKHYLVNGTAYTTRTPTSNNGNYVFKGSSLTLDNAEFALKGPGSSTTIEDLRVYNAKIANADGNCYKFLRGKLTVFGTVDYPSVLQGSGDQGDRVLQVESRLVGASDSCLLVEHDGTDKAGCEFFAFLLGDSNDFAGKIVVSGKGASLCSTGNATDHLGATPQLTLKNGGGLIGSGDGLFLDGLSISVQGGARFGAWMKNNEALTIDGGATIFGTGTLLIDNPNPFDKSKTYGGATVLKNVSITGLDGISVERGALQLGLGYANAALPVTLKLSSKLIDRGDAVTVGPLTMNESSSLVLCLKGGSLDIAGTLTKNTTSGKIAIDIADQEIEPLTSTNAWRILSAENLGTEGGLTVADFTVSVAGASDMVRYHIENGALSIESDRGKNYLVYTSPRKSVVLTGSDASGNGSTGSSFLNSGRWSDLQKPHADADYFVPAGTLLRAPDSTAGIFPNTSLSIFRGGTFAVQGATVTVPNLKLFAGSILSATRDTGNNLAGKIAVYGSADDPAIWQMDVAIVLKEPRPLTVSADISGSGSVMMRYNPTVDKDHKATAPYSGDIFVTGDNRSFSGEWLLAHWNTPGIFEDANAMGGATAVHFMSNGILWAQNTYTIPSRAFFKVDASGSDEADPDHTNGGTARVDAGKTLTVESEVIGNGIFRKTGTGTLRLTANRNSVAKIEVREGLMSVSGAVTNEASQVKVLSGAALGGAGKFRRIALESGAALDLSLTQGNLMEIGSLTLDGNWVLQVRDVTGTDSVPGKIAVAKVGNMEAALGAKTKVTLLSDGQKIGSFRCELKDGILSLEKVGLCVIVR